MRRTHYSLLATGSLAMLGAIAASRLAAADDPPRLMEVEQRLIAAADRLEGESLALLEKTVNIPSGTLNLDGVRRVGEVFAEEFRRAGLETRWAEMPPEMQRAGHLVAEHKGTQGKRLLLIGHLDTVLEGAKFQRNGDIARGNGTVDMKAGNIIILHALRALHEVGAMEDRRVIVVLTGDEEDAGMPLSLSRAALIEEAGKSDVALGFESAVGRTATVARRGVADWRLEVRAQTGHSESVFTDKFGDGAIYEAARILDAFRREVPNREGVTLNPSVITGGTTAQLDPVTKQGGAEGKTNVIPAAVVVAGDLRSLSPELRKDAEATMRRIVKDHLRNTSADLTFAANEYPAMAATSANLEILNVLSRASEDLGMGKVEALDPNKRGAGDISFVAHLLPCLDGLGARGNAAHTPDEDVELPSIPEQTRRAALLIYRLTR